MFEEVFFGTDPRSIDAYRREMLATIDALIAALPPGAFAGWDGAHAAPAGPIDLAPPEGAGMDRVRAAVAPVVERSIPLWHPRTAAHLQCPVLIPALTAEVVISALNQSMDSFDQAPSATRIEQEVVTWLCGLAGLPAAAGGTFTAGGTQSNYMGLLLARDHYLEEQYGWDARRDGLPPGASRLRILCSDMAHFSVEKSAIQLGLGTRAVVKVPCDAEFRLSPAALREAVARLRADALEPFAVVATAGTTDFGSFDPLPEIGAIAAGERLWLHVDAAYGGALLLSPSQRHALAGLESADSVTIDFHKAFFQPISCGAFLLADSERFRFIRLHADYLNPAVHEARAIDDLVTRSVLTTRRFDALKVWISLQAVGRDRFGAMIDRLGGLARHAHRRLTTMPEFVPLHQPEFGCLVFRYVPADPAIDAAAVNAAIPPAMFERGAAVIGHTAVQGLPALKLTFSNPCTDPEAVDELIQRIAAVAAGVARDQAAPVACSR